VAAHDVFGINVLHHDRDLGFLDVDALDQVHGWRVGVVSDQQEIAKVIAAHHDAARPRDALQEIPDRLPRLDLQALERRAVEVAYYLHADAGRRDHLVRNLHETLAVEIARRVDDAGAVGVPGDPVALEHDAVLVGIVRDLANGDDSGDREPRPEVDGAFVAGLELQQPPVQRDLDAVSRGELEGGEGLGPAVLDLDGLPINELQAVDEERRSLLGEQLGRRLLAADVDRRGLEGADADGRPCCSAGGHSRRRIEGRCLRHVSRRQGLPGRQHEKRMHDLVLVPQLVGAAGVIVEPVRHR